MFWKKKEEEKGEDGKPKLASMDAYERAAVEKAVSSINPNTSDKNPIDKNSNDKTVTKKKKGLLDFHR
jgi:hypothetical protein